VSPDEKHDNEKLHYQIDNLRVQKLFKNDLKIESNQGIFNELIMQRESMTVKDSSVNIGQKRINLDKMAEDSQRFNVCNANVFKFNDF
jgi:hypothetical protein